MLFMLFLGLQGKAKGEHHLKQRLLGGRKEALFSKPWHVVHSRSPPPSSCWQYRCSLPAFTLPALSVGLAKSCFSSVVALFPQLHSNSILQCALLEAAGLAAGRGPFSTGRAPAPGPPTPTAGPPAAGSAGVAPSDGVDVKQPMLFGRWEMFTS